MAPRKLSDILQERNISANELANKAGVSVGTVYRAKRLFRLSLDSAYAIAYALRLGINDIAWGRMPRMNTKPNGPTGKRKQAKTVTSGRLCNVHLEYYPRILDICPLCE